MDLDQYGRPEPPTDAGETATLKAFLDFLRATVGWKCTGLGPAELGRRISTSSMTLGGLVHHLAFVEDHWFSYWLLGRPRSHPWAEVDWASSPDWEWESAGQLSPEELLARWREAIEASDRAIETVLGGHGLDTLTERAWPDGTRPSLRWVMVHMIEEYGRHCGHADLLREAIDGATGE